MMNGKFSHLIDGDPLSPRKEARLAQQRVRKKCRRASAPLIVFAQTPFWKMSPGLLYPNSLRPGSSNALLLCHLPLLQS